MVTTNANSTYRLIVPTDVRREKQVTSRICRMGRKMGTKMSGKRNFLLHSGSVFGGSLLPRRA